MKHTGFLTLGGGEEEKRGEGKKGTLDFLPEEKRGSVFNSNFISFYQQTLFVNITGIYFKWEHTLTFTDVKSPFRVLGQSPQ